MRYKSIKLINYIGIYNGLKLNEIYIDFTKCKHNTILIKGDNGSGKSTLYNALNPLPDSNDFFIPGLPASKEIEIYDNEALYFLRFIHGIKNNGDREVTKAYIYKVLPNGMQHDMNPNGNVSSFKDIIYEEFRLDSNFVALSQLSNEDKGLADKKPAERKKFVTSIIETLEVYNDIYKTLSKRSNVFKSMINSITSKLDNLGNLEVLTSNLVTLDEKIRIYNDKKNIALERKADARATINIIDPDNSIQRRYAELNNNLNSLIDESKILDNQMSSLIQRNNIDPVNVDKQLESTKNSLTDTTIDIQTIKNKISTLLADREEDSHKLQIKVQKLKALQNEANIDTIKDSIGFYTDKIKYCEEIFDKMGVRDAIKISKEEYIIALNALKDIKTNIDYFKSDSNYQVLETALQYIASDTIPIIDDLVLEIDRVKYDIDKYKELIIGINNRDVILEQLNARPDDCKRDDCGFVNSIKQSISGMPVESLTNAQKELNNLNQRLELLLLEEKEKMIIFDHIGRIKTVMRTIENNRGSLQKFKTNILSIDSLEVFRKFINGESFKYIDEIYSYINYANLFEEYKIYKESLQNFQNQLIIYNSKNSIIEEIDKDITELTNKLNDLTIKIEEDNKQLQLLEQTQMKLNIQFTQLQTISNSINKNNEVSKEIDSLKKEVDSIFFNMDKIQNAISIVNESTVDEQNLSRELFTLNQERDKVIHSISIADDYRKELNTYSEKYTLVEKIRYYSSPTSGIQLVFMELYMSKILSLANELLALLFEGRFVIQPFIITDTEFRIPVLGNGYMNDDITSLSSGEKAMISMIISLSLLYQSSSRYNVLKLDEIDAPLDTQNRLQFLMVLEKLIIILQCEQCIMISHNNELNTDNVDLIILRNNSGETYSGNIIFKY